jgi:hypothetical protein
MFLRQLIAGIFAVPYKKSGLERIDDKWISSGRSDIRKLLCFFKLVLLYPESPSKNKTGDQIFSG